MGKEKDIEILISKDGFQDGGVITKSAIKHINKIMEEVKRRNDKISNVICGDCGEYLYEDIVKSKELNNPVLYCKNCIKECQHRRFKLIREMNVFCEIISEYKCRDCGGVFTR
ncbi:hypothetical protein LCGC14_0559940 [marine sediment metagenome]|uniref:Uncharacterized protein n=1 Tax=marine sediment metagenome TaxID=412755 RepID=A0A0F9S5V8_9ZZZZ